MTNHDLEARALRTFGLDGTALKFEKKIGMLSEKGTRGMVIIGDKKAGQADLEDWRKYGEEHGFELTEIFWGGSLIKDGKTEFVCGPLFIDVRNPNRLGLVYEEGMKDVFYSAVGYTEK